MKYIKEYRLFETTEKKAKEDFLKKKLISSSDFNYLKDNDPSSRKKYLYWMVKNITVKKYNRIHVVDLVNWFDKNQKKIDLDKRDINKLTVEDIEEMQKDPKFMSKKDRKALQKSSDNYDIVYEDSKGNKVIEIFNHMGCTYWTQLKTDKLEPASFCIGSYDNKKTWKKYMSSLNRKVNGNYMIILPNEKDRYKKIMLIPKTDDKEKGLYFVTFFDNDGESMIGRDEHIIYRKGTQSYLPQASDEKKEEFKKLLSRYPFIKKNIRNIENDLNKELYTKHYSFLDKLFDEIQRLNKKKHTDILLLSNNAEETFEYNKSYLTVSLYDKNIGESEQVIAQVLGSDLYLMKRIIVKGNWQTDKKLLIKNIWTSNPKDSAKKIFNKMEYSLS